MSLAIYLLSAQNGHDGEVREFRDSLMNVGEKAGRVGTVVLVAARRGEEG
jgi:hypothetical protein